MPTPENTTWDNSCGRRRCTCDDPRESFAGLMDRMRIIRRPGGARIRTECRRRSGIAITEKRSANDNNGELRGGRRRAVYPCTHAGTRCNRSRSASPPGRLRDRGIVFRYSRGVSWPRYHRAPLKRDPRLGFSTADRPIDCCGREKSFLQPKRI